MKIQHLTLLLFFLSFILTAGCGSRGDGSQMQATQASPITQKVENTEARLNSTEGGSLVLKAINAHGGLRAWYNAPTSSYKWTYASPAADMEFTTYLVANNRSRSIYHTRLSNGSYGNPQSANGRFAWNGENVWVSPPSLEQPNPGFWAKTGYYFEQIPFVLADPGLAYTVLPDETLDGTPYTMVKVSYNSGVGESPGDIYILYIDKQTHQVRAIRYTVTYGQDPAALMPVSSSKRSFITTI